MIGPIIFDIECDGLNPSKIHCMSVNIEDKIKSTTKYMNMRSLLGKASILVGHNIIRWDIPVLERLLGIEIKAKLVDTLALSWYLYPDRPQHGLEGWGEDFGVPKPKIDDWDNLTPEEYIHRCEEDVKINTKLWNKQWSYLVKLYGSEEEAWKLIDYLSFKMDCAREQERSGWKLDVDKCRKVLEELTEEYEERTRLLTEAMPKVPVKAIKTRPKKPFKKDGSYSTLGAKWFSLVKKQGLAETFDGQIELIVDWKEPNPGSSVQIKDWLYSLGWVPENFKFDRDKTTGDVRKIPQVRIEDEDRNKVLCPSVLKLVKKEPSIDQLDKVTVLSHRMGILKGFLENVDDRGFVKAEIQGLTNTLRFKHKTVVNLPGVFKPYGEEVRGCLIAPEGYELCGSDMASLEDRTKQHYAWEYDPEYVKQMLAPDFDPHLDIALEAKMLTEEQVADHKAKRKDYSSIRHKAKTTNYSATYGVGAPKLAKELDVPVHEAQKLLDAYWKRNWSIRAIADACKVKECNGQKWLFNPVSQLWYSLRHDKDRFSTLNQGTGSYCFDRWVMECRRKRPQLTAQFHDEVLLCIKKSPGVREKAVKLLKDSIKVVNEELKLNRELDVEVKFGDTYAKVH